MVWPGMDWAQNWRAELAMALNVTLVVVGGDVKTPEVKLRLPSTVGRGRDCSIMLRHPLVSRQHCEIFEIGGALMVRDLGSLNGTFVNNQRIEGDAPLQPGQLLTIGTVTFRAMYEAGATDSAPPTTPAPKMKTAPRPSSETDMDGTLGARPPRPMDATQIASNDADTIEPAEPIDEDMDFDLDDAQPLFSEAPAAKPAPPPPKKPGGSAETVYAGKGKPPEGATEIAAPAPAKPAAVAPPPAPKAPAAKVPAEKEKAPPPKAPAPKAPAEKAPAAKEAAKPADDASFGFLDADEETAKGDEEDDDLNDFLKNLK
jgi:predicted component of type VI protein secretion system